MRFKFVKYLIVQLCRLYMFNKFSKLVQSFNKNAQKEITSQTHLNLASLSLKTYVFEHKMTKY